MFSDSGAPTRASHAWDRAPYSWNMVYLFSFGCHVIDRLSKEREGCLRRVLANAHLLYRTFTIWSIDTCQNRTAPDQYPMTISPAHVSIHGGHVIHLEAVR